MEAICAPSFNTKPTVHKGPDVDPSCCADFGNAHWHGNTGVGTGPWAGADREQGMYYGGGERTQVNNESLSLTSDFVSLTLKGRTDGFTLKGGLLASPHPHHTHCRRPLEPSWWWCRRRNPGRAADDVRRPSPRP